MDEHTHEQLEKYVAALFAPEDAALLAAQQHADAHGLPDLSLMAHEARMLQWLLRLVGARKVVEIGTLGGYSGIWLARALPPDGRLYTLEVYDKYAQVARENFARAGVAARVELVEGDAAASLRELAAYAPFDAVFIDADKRGYPEYLRWAVEHLRPGGLLAAHNALRHGRVVAPQGEDDHTMDAFNRALAADPRMESTLIMAGDGMAVGFKRA